MRSQAEDGNVDAIGLVLAIGIGVVAGVLTARFVKRPSRSRRARIAVNAGVAYLAIVMVVILITAWRMT